MTLSFPLFLGALPNHTPQQYQQPQNHTPMGAATTPTYGHGPNVGGMAAPPPPHHVLNPNRLSTCSSDSDEPEEESAFARALREKKMRMHTSSSGLTTDTRRHH